MQTNEKRYCHDCGKEIEVEKGKLKNAKFFVYQKNGNKITIIKCDECADKSVALKNYQECEVYSRIVGYLRPVQQWNQGKKKEFQDRKEYKIDPCG